MTVFVVMGANYCEVDDLLCVCGTLERAADWCRAAYERRWKEPPYGIMAEIQGHQPEYHVAGYDISERELL